MEVFLFLVLTAAVTTVCYIVRYKSQVLDYINTVVHELGHYLVMRLWGIKPVKVTIGSSNLVFQFQVQGTEFYFHTDIAGSHVGLAPYQLIHLAWWKNVSIFAAGIGANIIFTTCVCMMMLWVSRFATTAYDYVLLFGGYYLTVRLIIDTYNITCDCVRVGEVLGHRTDGAVIQDLIQYRFGRHDTN